MDTRINNKDHLNHIRDHLCSPRCISWSAIVVGALVAIAFGFLLNLLCLGIGVSAFPTTSDGQLVFAVSGFIGLTICSILTMFPAGYVAGKLARPHCLKRRSGELHGLAAWTIALIVSILLGASLGNFVNQSSYVVTRNPVDIQLSNLNNNKMFAVNRKTDTTTAPVKVEIDPDKANDAAAMALFATFFIFFIGMLSACFGGRCAMMCKRDELEKTHYCEQCNK